MINDLKDSQKALVEYMSGLSEEAYCAVWMDGLEHVLWSAIVSGPRQYGRLSITEKHVAELRDLSLACGGWIAFDDNAEESWVPLDEWLKQYNPLKATE